VAATGTYYSGSGAGYGIDAGGNVAYRYSQATFTANVHICNGGSAGVGLGTGSVPIGVGTAPQVGSGENYPAAYAFAGITCTSNGTSNVYSAVWTYQDLDGTTNSGVFSLGPIALRDKISVSVYSNGSFLTATAADATTGASASTSWALNGTVFKSADAVYQFDAGAIESPPTTSYYIGAVTKVKFTQRNGTSVFSKARKITMTTDGSAGGAVWVAPKLTSSTSFSLASRTG
jgi:hypothetical protein